MNEVQPINNDINYETEQLYTPGEVSKLLGIKEATLRTWAGKLIKVGYVFYEVKPKQRGYFRWDIDCFKEIQRLMHEEDKPLSLDSSIITSAKKYATNSSKNMGVPNKELELKTDEIRLSKDDLKSVVQEAIREERKHWEYEQEKKIEAMFLALEDKLKHDGERRDRELVASLNHSLEKRQLELAATLEEEKMKESFIKRTLNKFFKQQVK